MKICYHDQDNSVRKLQSLWMSFFQLPSNFSIGRHRMQVKASMLISDLRKSAEDVTLHHFALATPKSLPTPHQGWEALVGINWLLLSGTPLSFLCKPICYFPAPVLWCLTLHLCSATSPRQLCTTVEPETQGDHASLHRKLIGPILWTLPRSSEWCGLLLSLPAVLKAFLTLALLSIDIFLLLLFLKSRATPATSLHMVPIINR